MNLANSESTIGRVAPVVDGAPRPFWSAMIPTYNCARFLRQTLESVLSQDPGPGRMQIEVVDDASTQDDPEAVVRECGQGRVQFLRQPRNAGVAANFNTCIHRSRGHWVHLLHGDDFVLPGFYDQMERAINDRQDIALACCRVFFVDEQGEVESLTPRLRELEAGGRQFPSLERGNPLQCAGVVVRRSFYEEAGGFNMQYRHVADWEMWGRATVNGGALAVNLPLAAYREFSDNDTRQLARTAENLRECAHLGNDARRTGTLPIHWQQFRRMLVVRAVSQASRFESLADNEAAAANWRFWREWAGPMDCLERMARSIVRRLRD